MSDDNKFVPAKPSDRKREGQSDENTIELNKGNTYGLGTKFDRSDKVTKGGGNYQDGIASHEYQGNFAEKNSSISRLDLVGKQSANCGTAYNSEPIAETYKPATSEGVPDANAIEYKTKVKSRNA